LLYKIKQQTKGGFMVKLNRVYAVGLLIMSIALSEGADNEKFKESSTGNESVPQKVEVTTDSSKDKKSSPVYLSVLFGASPLSISGMEDVHLSDWKNYGTGLSEGRAALNLSEGNTSKDIGTAIVVAASAAATEKIDVLVGIPICGNGDALSVGINLGVNYKLLDTRFLTIGIAPEIGFEYALLASSTVEMLPGKTSPIITENYTFYEGDQISGSAKGFTGSLSTLLCFNITKNIGIEAKAGIQYGIFGTPELEVGTGSDKKVLNFDDEAVVKAEMGSTEQIEYKGEISSTGFLFGIGIRYAK
jgi:hypothetical protein